MKTRTRSKLLFLIIMLIGYISTAQTIANFSIDSGGIIATSTNIKILYTIGEANIQERNVGNIYLSEGFINSNIVSATLGVDDNNFLEGEISIFPNPASHVINISSTLIIEKIELFDVLGKKVLVTKETNQLKIDHLTSGLYLLRVFSEKGTLTKRIIVD